MKNHYLKKGLAFSILILFIGLTLAPSINANVVSHSEPITKCSKAREETVIVNLHYFKPSGVENVNKKIPTKTLTYILELMDSEDFETLSYLLKNLDMAPKSMNVQQIEDLISGDLARKEYANIIERFNSNNRLVDRTEWKNIFCTVEGDAVDHFFDTPFTYAVEFSVTMVEAILIICLVIVDQLFTIFPWYPVDEFLGIGPIARLAYFVIDCGDSLKNLLNPYKNPERIVPVAHPVIGDWFPVHQNPNFTTAGLFGQWEIQDYQIIDITMVGFTGIWISYSDGYQYKACDFRGFSLFTKAKGINPE